ncbi:glycosyltransferase [Thermoclostridium stercorarium]|uniref:glycosyltransferase family 2 protein n=1 Tax=Thermoclostridium stercorarium TaxID=1510 RepID=UPI002249A08F|nr:glycosyltransferase family 2 protein [Thermoclostridium stercorarium]UZQ85837.1 glycosyltransferase [Thermoclostridium stercorarium]
MALPLVSIIVPVYNAEKTLVRCVNSILKQQYQNTEIILVNDGSTDNSLSICREYEKMDSRIKVIDKPNTGVSDTRNIGMAHASGEYFQFVDSDDWISENATKVLVDRILETNCDMVISGFYRVINGKKSEKGHIPDNKVMDKKEFISHMMKAPANFYYGVMWNKLYRADIIKAHRITCCTDLNWCEDFLFNLDYIRYSESFASLNIPIYYYVKTKNSLVEKQCTLKNIISMKIKLFESYKELFESTELYEQNRAQIRKFFIAYAKDGGLGYGDTYFFENCINFLRRRKSG